MSWPDASRTAVEAAGERSSYVLFAVATTPVAPAYVMLGSARLIVTIVEFDSEDRRR